jgi:hypothetical protein
MLPYRGTPPSEAKIPVVRVRDVGRRDITLTWRFLVVLALIRLALAFTHGERPFQGRWVTEPGFAFLVLLVAAPRAARGLRAVPGARREASRDAR